MSFSKPQRSTPAQVQAGFTLVELLVAAALSLIVLGLLLNMLVTTGSVKARSALQLSVDESMRASLELMSMDLRESMGPRVVRSDGSLPGGLATFASGNTSFSVTRMAAENIFRVDAPPGYPTSNAYNNSSTTRIITPNSANKECDDVFTGGEYALVTTGSASNWVKLHDTNPCTSSVTPAVLHPATTITFPYTPQTILGRVDVIHYAIQTVDGVASLTRQIAGGDVQVVAPDITAMQIEYSADGATFAATPVQPVAVRITLTGQRSSGQRSSTLTLSSTVFMRDIAVPAPVGAP